MERFYTDMWVTNLEKMRNDYTAELQAFSKRQKELWQQVPYLALQADGRGGYNGHYATAYQTGFWVIDGKPGSQRNPFRVNCATGAICFWSDDAKEVGSHFEGLLGVSIEQIDVNRIIDDLKKAAERGYSSWDDPEKVEAWRKQMIEDYKVTMICDQVVTKVTWSYD